MARKRLGELLLEQRLIDRAQLEQALAYQRRSGQRLGASLVALGFLKENHLCEALAKGLGLRAVRMPPESLDWSAVHTLRARFCEANDVFPLALQPSPGPGGRRVLVVAMADPMNLPAIEEIEFTTGLKVQPAIAPLSGIRAAIRQHYLKQLPNPHDPDSDKMTIIRPGGREDVVSTSSDPHRGRTTEAELPLAEIRGEVTERSALADLIRRREQQRKKKRPAHAVSADPDLEYFGGSEEESPEAKLEKMEVRFWALLRIMAAKGLISRDEFLRELDRDE